jgi:hypothetical protein
MSTLLELSVYVPLQIPVFYLLPLVVCLFTLCKRNFNLCKPSLVEIYGERNESKAFFLSLSGQFLDFPPVQQEFLLS